MLLSVKLLEGGASEKAFFIMKVKEKELWLTIALLSKTNRFVLLAKDVVQLPVHIVQIHSMNWS